MYFGHKHVETEPDIYIFIFYTINHFAHNI